MKNILFACVLAVAISGCASVNKQPISDGANKELSGQSVAHTARSKPDFAAMTAGKATFALIGAALMVSEGNALIEKNKIPDPADAIASGLMQKLENARGMTQVPSRVKVDADDAGTVASAGRNVARFVVDVQTINWSFMYFPTDWTHYRVVYIAKARLIDSTSGKTVAEGFCRRVPEASPNAPTYDELLENEASLLKNELAIAAKECVDSLGSEMLAI